MVTVEQIAEARIAERAAHEALIAASKQLTDLETLRACQLHNVGIGKFVENKDGEKFLVTRIKAWGDDAPWIYGRKLKKDGAPSEQETWVRGKWHVL